MNMNEIKAIAKERGFSSGRMKKAELIRTLQQTEGNLACFETGQAGACGQPHCLWREDCA